MLNPVRSRAATLELSAGQFHKIGQLVYRLTGINLKPGKEELVKTRLSKRILQLNLGSFDEYLKHVRRRGNEGELTSMLNALTTNKTSFFREGSHFEFLRTTVLPWLEERRRIRIWSAGCSSGEEPVSIAMMLRRHLTDCGRRDVRLLATDLSTQVLDRARQGRFAEDAVKDIPHPLLRRYLRRDESCVKAVYQARPEIFSMIAFARLNLMSRWPMKGPFEVIFCRNVMIYFDKPTQERLVGRFAKLLPPGGYLLIGHSESLTGLSHPYRFIQPAVYQKPCAEGPR